MDLPVRVASLGELPPGRGKVIDVAGRRVTVFNVEGRLHATVAHAGARAPVGETTDCSQHGLAFEVAAEDSPARLRADERSCRVWVEGEHVWLALDG